jgi:hypothetical protein
MFLVIWLIVWLIQGTPHIMFPESSWAIGLYVCAALSLIPTQYHVIRRS